MSQLDLCGVHELIHALVLLLRSFCVGVGPGDFNQSWVDDELPLALLI